MGGRQSKLKRELAAVKEQAAVAQKKHADELEAVKRDKRELEFKLNVLQELTAQAQLDAEKAAQAARESEERMQALKWELVRKLTVSASAPPTASSARTSTTSSTLAAAESLSPRVALSWKLRDGVALRRANTTALALGASSGGRSTSGKQRPHAQSEPVMSRAQPQRLEPGTKTQQDADVDARRSDAPDAKQVGAAFTKITAASNSNNSDEESKSKVSSSSTAVQSVGASGASSTSTSASSSEDEMRKPASKFPPLSRKKVARSPATASESKASSGASEQSEPETDAKAGDQTRSSEHDVSSDRESASSKRGAASRQSHADVLAFSSDDDVSS